MTTKEIKKVNTVSTISQTVEVPTHQKTERVKIQIQAPPNGIQSIVSDQKRIRKKCIGCCDTFTCSNQKDYDYCRSCSLNNNRYLNKKCPCSECDGSGIIKFPNQPPRSCKLCSLTNQTIREENIFTKNA